MKGMDRLLALQRLEAELERLEARREELEAGGEIGAAQAVLDQAERRLGDLRITLDSLAAGQRRLESDVDAFARKAKDEENRLYDGSVVNTKELEAVQSEIRSVKERKARTEDELLDRMERREELETEIQEAETEVARARAGLTAVGGDAARELEDIGKALAAGAAEREAMRPEIDEEVLEL